jgi:CheY-like chemotaxis protein
VAEAKDGREAVAVVESLRPDVLVVDIGMHNLNGIEAARQLTESQSGADSKGLSVLSPKEKHANRA